MTDKLLPRIEEWQNRPLDEVYPVLFIDAIHYSIRDNNVICRLAAYVILGINMDGRKEVLTIEVGQNGSAKYWLSVLNKTVITSCRAAHDPLPNRDIMR